MSEQRSYPRSVKTDAGDVEFRHMTQADEAAVLDFARGLPAHDLLFLPRNISRAEGAVAPGSRRSSAARSSACSR